MYQAISDSHFVVGLAPVADALSGSIASDVVDMSEFGEVVFVLHKGAGATGTSTITIEACDDTTPSNTSAIPFKYRRVTAPNTHGTLTSATAAGFTTTAAASDIYVCSVQAQDLVASGYRYVRLAAVEVANDPVLAGIVIVLFKPTYAGTHNSQID